VHWITQLVPLICGLSLLLVLSFASIGFCAATPFFPSPQKPTFPNSNSTRNQVDKEPLGGYATLNRYLFVIYLFIIIILWIVIYSADSTIQHLNNPGQNIRMRLKAAS